jgi:membrane-associated phospholipid phosphatase
MKYLVDLSIVLFLLVSFPVAIYIFGGRRVTFGGIGRMCARYEYHFYLLFFILILKTIVFILEAPVESIFSMDLTPMIYDFESNSVFWIQKNLYHPWMTVAMIGIYIYAFIFIFVFSFVLFAYLDKFRHASNLILLNFILLLITIPCYFFVVVYVPSYPKMFYPGAQSLVKGLEPLMYNFSQSINDFIVGTDTFNNCMPSMHIGYPLAILLYMLRRIKGFYKYKIFLFVMLVLITISILYLGIHWILDILGGIAIAWAGLLLTEKYSYRFWKRSYRTINRIERYRDKKGLNLSSLLGRNRQ